MESRSYHTVSRSLTVLSLASSSAVGLYYAICYQCSGFNELSLVLAFLNVPVAEDLCICKVQAFCFSMLGTRKGDHCKQCEKCSLGHIRKLVKKKKKPDKEEKKKEQADQGGRGTFHIRG